MTHPDFFLIGAGRSGTTSLYHYVRQHPDVYMSPVKEPNFFARGDFAPDEADGRTITRWEEYETLFSGVRVERAVGEASPAYLFAPGAAARIHRWVPRARILAVLRHPVDRAHSAYLKYVRDGIEPREFAEALEDERRGRRPDLPVGCRHYLDMGYYHRHLSRYYRLFDPVRIRVFLHEDLSSAPLSLVQDIFGFLGVDPRFVPDVSIRYNAGGRPRNRLLHRIVRKNAVTSRLRRVLPDGLYRRAARPLLRLDRSNLERPRLSADLRAELTAGYREDILRLEELIDRDLSHWLGTEGAA